MRAINVFVRSVNFLKVVNMTITLVKELGKRCHNLINIHGKTEISVLTAEYTNTSNNDLRDVLFVNNFIDLPFFTCYNVQKIYEFLKNEHIK